MLIGDSDTPAVGEIPLPFFGIVHSPAAGDGHTPFLSFGAVEHPSLRGGIPPGGFGDMDTGFGDIPMGPYRAGAIEHPATCHGISHTGALGGMHTGYGNVPFPCSGVSHTD